MAYHVSCVFCEAHNHCIPKDLVSLQRFIYSQTEWLTCSFFCSGFNESPSMLRPHSCLVPLSHSYIRICQKPLVFLLIGGLLTGCIGHCSALTDWKAVICLSLFSVITLLVTIRDIFPLESVKTICFKTIPLLCYLTIPCSPLGVWGIWQIAFTTIDCVGPIVCFPSVSKWSLRRTVFCLRWGR